MITVLYFMTTGWACPACHGNRPGVISASTAMKAEYKEIDVSKDVESASKYAICGLPTVVVLKGGQEVGRVDNGVSKQSVIDLIKQAKEY